MHVVRLVSLAVFTARTSVKSSGPSPVLAKLKAMDIDPAICIRIATHRVLTYGDMVGLLRKQVPSPVILTYIKSTHAPCTLTNAQLENLADLGASGDLVNYLGKSTGFFDATERDQSGGAGKWKNDTFFDNLACLGEPPFAYELPAKWYNMGWMEGVF